MITDYGFVLARGDKRFRHFLKYTLFEVEKCISNFESKGISRTLERTDNYVIAKGRKAYIKSSWITIYFPHGYFLIDIKFYMDK